VNATQQSLAAAKSMNHQEHQVLSEEEEEEVKVQELVV
jgi:hypothetical protein